MVRTINIAKEFAKFPGGRLAKDGPSSGEEFRKKLLEPALREEEPIRVILKGAFGYPPSFLEEAFGGLIRAGFTRAELTDRLSIIAGESGFEPYVQLAWNTINEEAERLEAAPRKVS